MTLQPFYRFLSLRIWGNLPSVLQRAISRIYANLYNRPFTKYIIAPYCKWNYKDSKYLDQFQSATGNKYYSSFQDFFTRVYKSPPVFNSTTIWPCEGLLCDYGKVDDLKPINIKGDIRDVRAIFGESGKEIPGHYYFSNVFLHNNNYHRIHAPVSCRIAGIEKITGDLVLLRPWIYPKDPSLPALRNERVNLKLIDDQSRNWYLSIVGGPAVGTIVLPPSIYEGAEVALGQEVGLFLLGSTCCMASPVHTGTPLNSTVFMGQDY